MIADQLGRYLYLKDCNRVCYPFFVYIDQNNKIQYMSTDDNKYSIQNNLDFYCNFGNVDIYFHKENAMLFSSVTVAVINIILDYILIQKYGYIAASYATMVSYYIYAGLHYMIMSRVCKEKKVENPFNASVIIVMTIVFSVFIMCPALLYRVVLLRYSILAVLCIICLLWAIKNRDFILQLISKKRV